MVALINVEQSLPRPLWALVRHLAAQPGRKQSLDSAKSLLSPPSLFKEDTDTSAIFDKALRLAKDLALVNEDEGTLVLRPEIDGADLVAFYDLVRWKVLNRVSAQALATDPSLTDGKDLLRALCWFLTRDSQMEPVTKKTFGGEQHKALDDGLGNPLRNETRWNLFTYWAPALGFADRPLLGDDGLVPDATRAVRGAVRAEWKPGTRLDALAFVNGLLHRLPVFPGGAFSKALGLPTGPHGVAGSLAFALQRGQEEGWLRLTTASDASNGVQYLDPAAPGGIGLFTDVEIGDATDV
ncbi:protein DpdG [Actinoplanes sp. DH11]|uniref:protein DpdG n=1 Tax=Actinoplanes sp. DH11 TaxID=2857011 RepID=UPI001E54D2B9|nr:protein DpdG [Actinoplanes sp. DH11]